MKIAIIHDWLTVYAGAERVLEQLLKIYPRADIFTVVDFLPKSDRAFLEGHKITTSIIQKLPFARARYRHYLPLMPLVVEQFDLSGYDIILSSSHAVAKGVITGPDQIHLCICYSPMRYAWDLQHQYLREGNLSSGLNGLIARYFLHKIRLWDLRTANGVDQFVAISKFIQRRVWKVYRRNSIVLYPPVAVQDFTLQTLKEDFYLTASRMVPYKRLDLIVSAFAQMSDKKLVVIGDGPDFGKLKKLAKGCPNISLLGYQPFNVLKDHMQKAKAFVFAAEEDFGITPLEAQACGTPVIAFARGGALETLVADQTAIFFADQSVESILGAISRFEKEHQGLTPEACRKNAERFSEEVFISSFLRNFDRLINNRLNNLN